MLKGAAMRALEVSYGPQALRLLRDLVAEAKVDDPLAPVTVVVPSNSAGTSARRVLASGRYGRVGPGDGVAGINLVTVRRLAELLGAPPLAAEGRRPASTPVVAAAIRSVLAEAPGVFGEVADHPATTDALVRSHRELADCDEAALDELSNTSTRAADVVRIHRAVRDRLAASWYEEADLLRSARQVVDAGSPVVRDLGTVLIHLPQNLSWAEADLLGGLAVHCPTTVVAGVTGIPGPDAVVRRSLARLGADIEADAEEAPASPAHGSRIISVSDADEEARSAVGEILAAARAGVAMERIAVLYPARDPYARILHEHLDAAGVTYNGTAARPLSERVLGRWVLDLLDLPRRDFDRAAVMRLLTSAPVRADESTLVPARSWERISRDAGVVRCRDGWDARLAAYAEGRRARADLEEEREDPAGWRIERDRRDAQQADHLRAFVCTMMDDLGDAAGIRRWDELARWVQDAIDRYLGAEPSRRRWPRPEQLAAQRVEAAVERLAGLGEIETETSLEVMRRSLELELDEDLGRTGRLGEGVLVGPPAAALGVDLDVVILLGMAEGVMPARPQEDPLLHDVEREVVAEQLPPRRLRIADQHRHVLAALASSARDRILIFPRGDLRRSVQRSPSRWLLDTMEVLTGERAAPDASDAHTLTVPSFASRASRDGFPPTLQSYTLRSIAAHLRAGHDLATHELVTGLHAPARSLEMMRARRAPAFGRFDGNLTTVRDLLPSPLDEGRATSATGLEEYLRCPHGYLMRHILYVQAVENPEELLQISPLDRGSLVHDVLEVWLREQLESPPAPHEPWPATAQARFAEIAEDTFRAYERRGVTGHWLLWQHERERLLVEFARFIKEDDQRRRRSVATPVAAELPFGLDGQPFLEVEVAGRGTIHLRGRIDRIDRTESGMLLVTDYKTGSTRGYTDLSGEQPLGDGTKLQLPLYALASRLAAADGSTAPVKVSYWFTSTRGEFKEIGYEVTDDVLAGLQGGLGVVLDGIDSGHFPLRPSPPVWQPFVDCDYCDPDGLGTTQRFRRWEQLRRDSTLRDYVQHVEPDALPDPVEVAS